MNNGYFNSVFDEQTTAQKTPQMLSATGMESFLATVSSVGSLPFAAYDWYKLQEAKDPYWSDQEPSAKLSVDEANKKYGIAGKLTFQSDIRDDAAQLMYDRKKKEIADEQILSQRTSGQALMSIPQSIAASILDPINLAASFIPIVGEARLLKLGQTVFKTAKPTLAVRASAKAIAGGANAAITSAPIQMATAGLLSEYQADYDMNDALVDTAYAAVGGAVLHTGLGLATDAIKGARLKALTATPQTKVHVAASAAADLASGKPVNSAEVLLSLDSNNLKISSQDPTNVVFEAGKSEAFDPAKPAGIGEVPQHYVADFKFDPNAPSVELVPGEIKPGFESVSFDTKYFGKQENVSIPVGTITPDDVGSFVSGHPNLKNLLNPKNQKSLTEVWQYLANLGLKHDDVDWSIPYNKVTMSYDKLGMQIRGVQSQVFFLTGDKAGYIIKVSGSFMQEIPVDLEIPGLTTIAINEKIVNLPGGGAVRVQIGERIYSPDIIGPVKYLASKENISIKDALEKFKNLSALDKKDLLTNNEVRTFIADVRGQIKNDLSRKFAEKGVQPGDVLNNPGNYGARLPENINDPINGLMLDTGGFQYLEANKIRLAALNEIRQQNALAIQAQNALDNAKQKIAELEKQGVNQESTSWQPGDKGPIEVPAKDLVAQSGVRPEDANLDARLVAQDAEEIIAQFRAEMSETDLNVLKDFDRLAKEAEGAEVGFMQAANCVINNLL